MEIRYCGEGTSWSARAHLRSGSLVAEGGRSAAEAVGRVLFLVAPDTDLTLMEHPRKPGEVATFEGQAILLAVVPSLQNPDAFLCKVLAVSGEWFRGQGRGGERAITHLIESPTARGLHAWEGKVVVEDPGFLDEATAEGSWRPATLADFGRFGLATPG